jgi:hypothetical protein
MNEISATDSLCWMCQFKMHSVCCDRTNQMAVGWLTAGVLGDGNVCLMALACVRVSGADSLFTERLICEP